AGAGLASKMAGTLNDISKGIASATGSDLIGNLAANIAAGVGGAALGGTAGAAMGSNVHLYNQTVDDERALTGDPGKKSPTLFSLAMQGIVNGLNAILGTGGGGPPAASPGVVLVNGAGQALAGSISSSLTVAGYVPTNATFSSGSGDGQSSANNGNTNDLESAANQPFKDGQAITSAGRAVTKHPEYFGFDSTQDLRQVYRSDAQLNEVAANAVRDILQNGTKTTGAGGRYPDGWVTYTLPDGRAASGEFIGFRGLQK
ncbi:hypothetical protein, partial [Paraburkholderia tropica]|uniref:hypothetical protein n=1 Tax=Paraburkholderia tropica TaxID=92647 RepID=UPI002AB2EF88